MTPLQKHQLEVLAKTKKKLISEYFNKGNEHNWASGKCILCQQFQVQTTSGCEMCPLDRFRIFSAISGCVQLSKDIFGYEHKASELAELVLAIENYIKGY